MGKFTVPCCSSNHTSIFISHTSFTSRCMYLHYSLSYVYMCTAGYLSLGSTIITTNNSEVIITDIGEDAPIGLPSLTCNTDLTTCCRNSDTGGQGGRGEWYYPDGTAVKNNADSVAADDSFYRVRNAPQVIRLARRNSNNVHGLLSPTGSYCCVIPTTGGDMTFCANIGERVHSVQW